MRGPRPGSCFGRGLPDGGRRLGRPVEVHLADEGLGAGESVASDVEREERLSQEGSAQEEADRNRDLSDDQTPRESAETDSRSMPAPVLEHLTRVVRCGADRWADTRDEGDEHREATDEEERARVDREVGPEGHALDGALEPGDADLRQPDAEHRGSEDDRSRLEDELSHQASPSRSERQPERELACSPRVPREEQVRDVRGHQQHE